MSTRVEALITPVLLRWGRKTAGYDVDTASAKAGVKPEALASWESGQARPSIPQLRKLAKLYKRPIAVFYLPEPPRDFQVPKDYRRPAGVGAGSPSPALLFQLREAQYRRDLFLELYQQTEGDLPPMTLSADLNDDPETVAQRIRSYLDVPLEAQKDWAPRYDTMNRWRSAFGRAGVLVFQMQGVPWKEARGFSVFSDALPLAVVNVKDAPNGRIFTMFHELAHIALRRAGICDLRESGDRAPELNDVEVYCNAVAGAVLVPREPLLKDELVRAYPEGHEWRDGDLRYLARKFHCSTEVVTRRLLACDKITHDFYLWRRAQFTSDPEAGVRRQSSGPVPPARQAISKFGHLFVRVALSNYYQDNITGSDLSDLLELRMKHLPKLEEILDKSRSNEAYA